MATRTRERLSRETLAAGALALADREGLEAVTIRRLATDHDVTPMALYWHFKDKDAVFDGIAEQVYASVTVPEPNDDPWDEQLRSVLQALLVAVRPHPLVADLLAPRIMTSEPGLELAERVIGMLRTAGFPTAQATETASFLLCAIIVLVTSEPGKYTALTGEAQEDLVRTKRAALESLSPKRFPNLVESAEYFITCDDSDTYYAVGMNFLLAGIRGTLPE